MSEIKAENKEEKQMSREECLKVLGLPENADDNAVKQRYGALLRQYKRHVDEKGTTYDDLEYYKKITTAYDNIMGITHDFGDDNPTSPIPYKVRRKFAKFAAFVDQYKLLIVLGVLVICLGVMFVFQAMNNEEEDIAIKFVGAYGSIKEREVISTLNNDAECFDNSQVSFFTVTSQTSLLDNNAKTNASAFLSQLMAGALDVVLIDEESYEAYVEDYTFLKLDDLLAEYEAAGGKVEGLNTYHYDGKTTDKGVVVEEGIYGIEVTDAAVIRGLSEDCFSWFFDEKAGQKKTMIFTICRTSKRQEIAWKYGKELIEDIVPVDLSLNFAGRYDLKLKYSLEERIDEKFDSVINSQLGESLITAEDTSGARQTLTSGEWDVVIIDKESFDLIALDNVFLKLDDLIKKGGDGYESTSLRTVRVDIPLPDSEDESDAPVMESGIYGIDVSDNEFFAKLSKDVLSLNAEEGEKLSETMIFAVCRASDNTEKAWKFGEELFAGIKEK